MTDAGLRGIGSLTSKGMREKLVEPTAPPLPEPATRADVIVTPPPPATPARAIFAGDHPHGGDALGIDAALAHIAELLAHKRTKGPICVGLVGGAGSGKSFALTRLVARVRELAGAARQAPGPFEPTIHIETIDAATLEGDPALALAGRLHAGLRRAYPELAREIEAVARDPHIALREANDKLDEARRRLDSERRALDEAGSRRARLVETVLYEAAGSQVDSYARANRGSIETRLTSFGLHGDLSRTYKDLVREASASGGKFRLGLAALWGYKGQLKLILLAVLFVLAGIGFGMAIETRATWLESLRGAGKFGVPVADWLDAHIGLLSLLKTGAYGLAGAMIVANLYRAVSFLRPVLRGADLLNADLDNRRRDLDSLYAHQTKRVDALEGDVERLTKAVAEAERRAGHDGTTLLAEPSPFEVQGPGGQAKAVFASLSDLMAGGQIRAPKRILLAIDHLDALPPARAAALLDVVNRMGGEGLVTALGVDTSRLQAAGRDSLERWIQIPVRVDIGALDDAHASLVRQALGLASPNAASHADASRSDLDAPISEEEAELLASLASLAGTTPRRLRRFASLYQIARLGEERQPAILAFMLALMLGGSAEERDLVAAAFSGDPNAAFDLPQVTGRLRQAFSATVEAGGRVMKGEAAEAARRAAMFSLDA